VTVGKQVMDGVTKDTGDWTSMVTERLGTVKLVAGKPMAVELRALTKPGDAVMNVRSIVLTPAQ
jgi:hypothetical protein